MSCLLVEAYDPVSIIRMLFGIAKTPIFLSFKFAQPISSVQIEHTPSPFFVPLQKQIDDIIESKKGYMTAKDIENIVDSVPTFTHELTSRFHFSERYANHSLWLLGSRIDLQLIEDILSLRS